MDDITQAVIMAGGRGIRFAPLTKVIPKPMLPIPFHGEVKPLIEIIFEQLYDKGIRDFILVMGDNELVSRYFSRDPKFLNIMKHSDYLKNLEATERFYDMVKDSKIKFIKKIGLGTGDTLLNIEQIVKENFLVTAIDVLLERMPKLPINSVLVTNTDEISRHSILTVKDDLIVKMESRPKSSGSGIRLLPYLHFDKEIFSALKRTKPRNDGLHLHDGINTLIKMGKELRAVFVDEVYDFGDVPSYIKSISRLAKGEQ